MTTRIFWRCDRCHYVCTPYCPFDGWTSPELSELDEAAHGLKLKNVVPSVAALQAEGVSEAAIRRVIIIEFGSDKAAFEGFSPDHYVLDGKPVKLAKVGAEPPLEIT